MIELFREYLAQHLSFTGNGTVISLILMAAIAVAAVAFYYITKFVLNLLERFVLRTPTTWDDDLLNARMMRAISQLSPALAVNWLLPQAFAKDGGTTTGIISVLTSLYIVWAIVWIFVIFTGNLYNAFLIRPNLKAYAVKGVFQMFKLIFMGIGVIIALSILIGKSPVVIITALGASAAVLMLVFQDTILGLVASIQLSANKMLQRGDWIEARTHDVNGEVLEVTLTAVKVKNWDNSVSTIPPYALIKGSFRNYQPMRASGGRRVERPIYIDLNTVRFCTAEEVENLRGKGLIEKEDIGDDGREINLRLLRRYLVRYLQNHPEVNHSMTTMVRQLEPTNSGLPLEMYFFLSNTSWVEFESLASDIFDHIYAVVHEFGLSMFQTPAGTDLSRAK